MGKAAVVTDAITVVGMIVISTLMFVRVPGMIDDIKETLSQESVRAQAVEIANLISLVTSSPYDIEVMHKLPPEGPYTVTVKDGYVTVETGSRKAVDKTFSALSFGPDPVGVLSITKNEVKKVG